ncbi:MAG: porin family protein [Bacteroidales bacterium]|uniref:porin family protein n=1 Tax=Porphyromonas sp. TaxID=1924944 RepID=UPI002979DB6B|nr:outer membrane beta-barrel protein [Porphyromonas sp.]MDD7438501.1 porin family protein [Bacteroidales bacterium]MDY3066522.1 porin family protein [Porphyromonas sp.]
MRKLMLFIGALLLFVALESSGQAPKYKPRFMIGSTAGVNVSNMIFTPKVYQGLKLGYDAGVVLRYDVGHVYDMQNVVGGIWVEIDYSTRGWKEKPRDLPQEYAQSNLTYQRTLSYISMPILTHLSFGQNSLKFTVDLGAQFGYLISESSSGNFPEGGIPGVVTRQQSMPVENKFAWGIGGGVGSEYHFDKMIAGIRASYVYGLGEIYGNSRSDYFGKSSEQIIAVKAYVLFSF